MTDPNDPIPNDARPEAENAFSAELQDLLDGRLDDAAADALRARIEREPALGEQWEELRGIQRLVRGYGPQGAELDPPVDFLAGVQARVSALKTREAIANDRLDGPQRSVTPPPRSGRMLRMLTLSYAAAALLVVGFTVRYVLETPPPAGETTTDTAGVKPPAAGALEDTVEDEDGEQAELEGGLSDQAKRGAPLDGAQGGSAEDKLLRLEVERKRRESKAGDAGETQPRKRLASSESSEFGEKSGRRRGGAFGAPGGAVQPGARPPSGTKAKKPADRGFDDPAADSKARRAADGKARRAADGKARRAADGKARRAADGKARPSEQSADRPTAEPAPPPDMKQPPAPTKSPSVDGFAGRRLARLAGVEKAARDGEIVYVLEVEDAATARLELATLLGTGLADKKHDKKTGAGAVRKRASEGDVEEEAKDGAEKDAGPAKGGGSIGIGGGSGGKLDRASARTLVYRPDAKRLQGLLAELRAAPLSKRSGARPALVDVVTPELSRDALLRLEVAAARGVWGRAADARVRRADGTKPAAPTPKAKVGAPKPTPAPPTPTSPPTAEAPVAPGAPAAPTVRAPKRSKAKGAPRIRILLVERKR